MTSTPTRAALLAAALASASAAQTAPAPAPEPSLARRIVLETLDEIHVLRAAPRRVTAIFLPSDETLAQAWTGDPEYWSVQGTGNLVFVKPARSGMRTNVSLTCESGRVYSFVLDSSADQEADLNVRLERSDRLGDGSRPAPPEGFGLPEPKFVPATAIEEYRINAESAYAELAELRSSVPELLARESDRVRRVLASEMRFEYKLQAELREPPFEVRAMWHDGRYTFLQTAGLESPALYALSPSGEPELIDYELQPGGLYVVSAVLDDGFMLLGERRARWIRARRETPSEELLDGER